MVDQGEDLAEEAETLVIDRVGHTASLALDRDRGARQRQEPGDITVDGRELGAGRARVNVERGIPDQPVPGVDSEFR